MVLVATTVDRSADAGLVDQHQHHHAVGQVARRRVGEPGRSQQIGVDHAAADPDQHTGRDQHRWEEAFSQASSSHLGKTSTGRYPLPTGHVSPEASRMILRQTTWAKQGRLIIPSERRKSAVGLGPRAAKKSGHAQAGAPQLGEPARQSPRPSGQPEDRLIRRLPPLRSRLCSIFTVAILLFTGHCPQTHVASNMEFPAQTRAL